MATSCLCEPGAAILDRQAWFSYMRASGLRDIQEGPVIREAAACSKEPDRIARK